MRQGTGCEQTPDRHSWGEFARVKCEKILSRQFPPKEIELVLFNRENQTPAQVPLAWAVQRDTAVITTPKTPARAHENFDISALPDDAFEEINHIGTRQRFNTVTNTGVPGFIPQGR